MGKSNIPFHYFGRNTGSGGSDVKSPGYAFTEKSSPRGSEAEAQATWAGSGSLVGVALQPRNAPSEFKCGEAES